MSRIGHWALAAIRQSNRIRYGLRPRSWRGSDFHLRYLETNPERDGPTVVFLHGLGANKDRWGADIYRFARDFHCLFLDLPGEGESSFDPELSYTPGDQVERLHQFFSTQNLAPFVLIGASVGGCIAALYAARYPDRINKLVVIDPAGISAPRNSPVMEDFLATGEHPFAYRNVQEMEALWNKIFYNKPRVPGILARAMADKGRERHQSVNAIVGDFRDAGLFPLDNKLSQIQAETLVLWGEHDAIFNVSTTETVWRLLPKPRIRVIARAGHVPYLEQGGETVREIEAFLGCETDYLVSTG